MLQFPFSAGAAADRPVGRLRRVLAEPADLEGCGEEMADAVGQHGRRGAAAAIELLIGRFSPNARRSCGTSGWNRRRPDVTLAVIWRWSVGWCITAPSGGASGGAGIWPGVILAAEESLAWVAAFPALPVQRTFPSGTDGNALER